MSTDRVGTPVGAHPPHQQRKGKEPMTVVNEYGGVCLQHGLMYPCPRCTPQPAWPLVTTRHYPMECPSCRGSGKSTRPLTEQGTGTGPDQYHDCAGCRGTGGVEVIETTPIPSFATPA